eukprot:gene15163-17800_t
MPETKPYRRPRPHRRPLLAALGASGAAAVGLSFGLDGCAPRTRIGANGEEAKLNFYNWDTYVGKDTLAEFKQATGVDVNMSLFANNDELFAKLRAGNPGFDLIVPTNEFVTRLRLADLIQPLDHSKIPNFKNLAPEFQSTIFDPGRRYSIPYTWLVLGVGYPLALTGIAQAIAPGAANGSLVRIGGRIVGSRLIGQTFTRDGYVHGRPSAAGDGYDPTQSGGSNLGPMDPKLADRIAKSAAALGVDRSAIPEDAVTTSASGLDPDISPTFARLQAPRVAAARHVDLGAVQA